MNEPSTPHAFEAARGAINVCAHCGEGPNTDHHAESAVSTNGASAPAPAKRGRKRAAKNQRTIDDMVIEDPELEEALSLVIDLEPMAAAFREARQKVKTIVQTGHEDIINAQTPEGRPRYAVVGNHRVLYKVATRPAGKKAPAAGVSTKLDVFRIDTE